MNENHGTNNAPEDSAYSRQIGEQAARKRKARARSDRSIWFGLGMSGLIGWSVTVPTLIGAALGLWADRSYPSPYSWTLMLLLTGLVLGCFNAWHWVELEDKKIQEDKDD